MPPLYKLYDSNKKNNLRRSSLTLTRGYNSKPPNKKFKIDKGIFDIF